MRSMFQVAPPTVGARGDYDPYGMSQGYGIQGGYGFGVGGPVADNGNGNGFMGWLRGLNPVLIVVGGILVGYWLRGMGSKGEGRRSYRYGASSTGARRVKKGRRKRVGRRRGKKRSSSSATTGARRRKSTGRRKKVRRKSTGRRKSAGRRKSRR